MHDHDVTEVHRRGFLQTGAAATATALTLASGSQAAPQSATKPLIPRRPLGKTGVDVTILTLGTWRSPGLDRLLRFAWAKGVRYYDTADCYGSEPAIGRWLKQSPENRKELFLVTKAHPRTPEEFIAQLDERLAMLQVDSVDMYLIHGIGGAEYGGVESLEWPTSPAWKAAFETIRKSGKSRFVGFSCHHPRRAEFLQAAATGGFVDAIMVQHSPWLDKDSPMNRALDACHARGIGLISMKQITGFADLAKVAQHVPTLKERGLTPYQGLLQAIWSDERISSCCVSMRNTDQINEDSHAAATFQEPMKRAEIEQLRDAVLATGPTFCADCDGRCARAAGTTASLGDLTRLLTYHDQYGYRAEARRLYGAMPHDQRDWSGADLGAARAACPNRLDFASLLPRIDENLA